MIGASASLMDQSLWHGQSAGRSRSLSIFDIAPDADRFEINTVLDSSPGLSGHGGVNGSVIRDGALVQAGDRTNALLWSEDLTNPVWIKQGDITASAMDEIAITSSSHGVYQIVDVTPGAVNAVSFEARRGSLVGDVRYSVYDDSNLAEIISADPTTNYYEDTQTDAWSTIFLTYTVPIGCTRVRIYPVRNGLGTGSMGLRKLQHGPAPGFDYIKTEAAPITRFIWPIADNGLKLDAEATNLFDTGEAANLTLSSILGASVAETETTPLPGLSWQNLIEGIGNNQFRMARESGIFAVAAGDTYTISMFVQAAGRTRCYFQAVNVSAGANGPGEFDLSAKTAMAPGPANVSISEIAPNVFRLEYTIIVGASGTLGLRFGLQDSAGRLVYNGDGVSGIRFAGLQIEAGSKASDYIATFDGPRTRTSFSVQQDFGLNNGVWDTFSGFTPRDINVTYGDGSTHTLPPPSDGILTLATSQTYRQITVPAL